MYEKFVAINLPLLLCRRRFQKEASCVVSQLCDFLPNTSDFGLTYFQNWLRLPTPVSVHQIRLLSLSRGMVGRQNKVLTGFDLPLPTQSVSHDRYLIHQNKYQLGNIVSEVFLPILIFLSLNRRVVEAKMNCFKCSL